MTPPNQASTTGKAKAKAKATVKTTMTVGTRVSTALHWVNEHDKWLVTATVGYLVVANWSVAAVWALMGSLCNAVVCKIAKKVINQPRPATATKDGPGMPSSHACSLMFLSCYAAALVMLQPQWNDGDGSGSGSGVAPEPEPDTNVGARETFFANAEGRPYSAAGVLALGLLLTWLRVAFGFHDIPQVLYVHDAPIALWRIVLPLFAWCIFPHPYEPHLSPGNTRIAL